MRFTTTVERCGPLLAGPEPAKGSGRGSFHYRSTVATMGGCVLLPLSAENRTAAGDRVAVDVELDDAPRVVEVPADLAGALDADPEARRRFDALSYSHQRRHVLAVEGAKADATRARRVAGVVAAMLDG